MNHAIPFCAVLLLLGSTACTTSATSTASDAPAAQPAGAEASAGKPSAAVTVRFGPVTPLALGVASRVETVITSTANVDALEVSYSLSEGLSAVDALPLLQLAAQTAGTVVQQPLRFVPRAEGQHYLNVFVRTRQGDQYRSKTVSLPLALGTIAAKPSAAVQQMPDGERVISMPASEPR
ncbi:MAG: hypothetical protein V4650_05635 [Pseudomonadota bacterium]